MEKADESLKRKISEIMSSKAATASEKAAKINSMLEVYSQLQVAQDAKSEIISLTGKALSFARKACKEPTEPWNASLRTSSAAKANSATIIFATDGGPHLSASS